MLIFATQIYASVIAVFCIYVSSSKHFTIGFFVFIRYKYFAKKAERDSLRENVKVTQNPYYE